MALFAVIGLDHQPHAMELRDRFRDEHRRYVLENDQDITFVGVCLDAENNQCASFYIFEADSEEDVRAWLDKEAFVQNGVYERLVIRRFMLAKNHLPAQDWPNK